MKKHMSRVLGIALRASSRARKSSQSEVDAKIAKGLQEWIEAKGYCKNSESMDEVADSIGVSSDALSYFCNHILGVHFATLRKNLRMKEAKEQIRKNPYSSIVSVAYNVGIYDKCNFRRQFYEQYGVNPSEWRRKCRRFHDLHLL